MSEVLKVFEAISGTSLEQVVGNVVNQKLYDEWQEGDKSEYFINFWFKKTGKTSSDPEFQEVMKFIVSI